MRRRSFEAAEDGADGLGVGEEGEDAHVRSAVGASEGEDLVDAGEEAGPAGRAAWPVRAAAESSWKWVLRGGRGGGTHGAARPRSSEGVWRCPCRRGFGTERGKAMVGCVTVRRPGRWSDQPGENLRACSKVLTRSRRWAHSSREFESTVSPLIRSIMATSRRCRSEPACS
jgi:hypothetical protein